MIKLLIFFLWVVPTKITGIIGILILVYENQWLVDIMNGVL